MLRTPGPPGQLSYGCALCGYNTSNSWRWSKHLETQKHQAAAAHHQQEDDDSASRASTHMCATCGKVYRHPSSLSRHRRRCTRTSVPAGPGQSIEVLRTKAALYDEHKQSVAELKALVEQVVSQPATTVNHLHINLILESRCSGAINMSEFINRLQLTLDDLSYTRENGCAKGVSQLLIKNLVDMQPASRPIQCVDRPGRALYIREANRWGIDPDGSALGLQINAVRRKQLASLKAWDKANPEWRSTEGGTQAYLKMVQELAGEQGQESRERCLRHVEREIGRACRFEDVVGRAPRGVASGGLPGSCLALVPLSAPARRHSDKVGLL
jgi:hypothetical protein